MVWDDRYQNQYGFFRPYVRDVIYRYLDFGDLHLGFARYYGYYSDKSRGMRKKSGADAAVPALMKSVLTSRAMRKSWARLIQKVYHVDPLKCPKCHEAMKIISFIEESDIIRKILVHLNLWDLRNHDPPVKKSEHIPELKYDDSCSQLPLSDDWMQ